MNVKKFVEKINVKQILKIVVFILLFLLVIGNLVTISYGVENLNMIRTFSSDENSAVNRVLKNLEYNDLDPRKFYNYGYFYHTVGFYILKTLAYFDFKVDTRMVTLVLRLISLLSYMLAGVLIYKLYTISFKGEKAFGLILVLFFLSTPGFSYWSRYVHPDTLQTLLVLLAALVAFSKHKAKNVVLGAAIAGAAFGTKYSAIFILPFLFLPYFLFSISGTQKNKKFWLKTISVFLLAILVFLAVWIITNPYILQNFNEFQKDFSYEKKHVGTGHGRIESQNAFLWFDLFWRQFGLLIGVIIAGTAAVLVSLSTMAGKDRFKKFIGDAFNRNLLTTILYTAAAFGYLMLEVNMRRPRYLLHILPFILIITIYGWQRMSCQFKHRLIKPSIIIFLLVAVSFLTWNTLAVPSIDTRKYDHEFIKAGNFLGENQKGDLKILADPYSYVPPKFKNTIMVWGIDEAKIKTYRPDIIILNAKIRHRYSWKKEGTSFKRLKFYEGPSTNSMHYYKFLKKLFSRNSQWKVLYESDNILILNKKRRFREGGWKKRNTLKRNVKQ